MIGKTVSHYTITRKLGEGGMGVVYEAYDTVLKRKVALKFLPADLTRDEESRKRFIREAQAAAALNHPNICTVHEIGEEDGNTFIVMPLIEGASLDTTLETGPLPLQTALDIAIQVGKGLAKAHQNDIVHRDIKPANILIDEDNLAKIVDFGIAKLGSRTRLTSVGMTVGTIGYMSPEQARGEEIDHRTDIWSLGAVLYEMLTGRRPFPGESDAAVIYLILNEQPRPLAQDCPDCPTGLEAILSTALAKDPRERFQSMEEMVESLEAVRSGSTISTGLRRSTGLGKARTRRIAAGIAIAMIASIIIGYLLWGPAEKIESIAVLPIINLSGNAEEGGFEDGLTGALINEMGHINSVRWIGHRSVMRYKDSEKSSSEIAAELNVDALIEGSVIRQDDRIMLTIQLVGVNPERQLWTDSFTRRYEDILTMYGEITRAIAGQVEAVISSAAAATLAKQRTVDPKAYENYLYGIYWLNASISYDLEGDLGKAMRYFSASLAIDSTYAPAWAGLAEVHIMSAHASPPAEHAVELALEKVKPAIELDPNVADSYRTLAHILWEHEWDMADAEQAITKGLELNPSDGYIHMIHSIYSMCLGRLEEGASAAKRSIELDPLSNKINAIAWFPMAAAGRTDEALAQLDRLNELIPGQNWTSTKGYIYALSGMYDRAIAVLEQDTLARNSDSMELPSLYLLTGQTAKADSLLDEFESMTDIDALHPWRAAEYYSLRGDTDRAMELLEQLYQIKFWFMTRLMINYRLKPLHDDPRFMDLARRIGVR